MKKQFYLLSFLLLGGAFMLTSSFGSSGVSSHSTERAGSEEECEECSKWEAECSTECGEGEAYSIMDVFQ